VAALLRMGREREAAMRFNSQFPEFEDGLSLLGNAALNGLFTTDEKQRLQSARNALARPE
jgi:hypothetical protein